MADHINIINLPIILDIINELEALEEADLEVLIYNIYTKGINYIFKETGHGATLLDVMNTASVQDIENIPTNDVPLNTWLYQYKGKEIETLEQVKTITKRILERGNTFKLNTKLLRDIRLSLSMLNKLH